MFGVCHEKKTITPEAKIPSRGTLRDGSVLNDAVMHMRVLSLSQRPKIKWRSG